MSEIIASAAPPLPAAAEKLKFYGLWVAAAIVLLLLPRIFSSGSSLTTFSLIGVSIIFSLSYNILLGQTGMLSFGHAVYYGLGGFLAIHAINIIGANKLPLPLPVVPLVGGLTGLLQDRSHLSIPDRQIMLPAGIVGVGFGQALSDGKAVAVGGDVGFIAGQHITAHARCD